MKVGFLHVGPDTSLAEIMVASASEWGAELIQMTDETSPAIKGCRVVRKPWDQTRLMTYRLQHLAELGEDELCVLDTDVIVQGDLARVFDWPFDVALTARGVVLDPAGTDVGALMPFNTGVMFAKTADFWKAAAERCAMYPEKLQTWYGDQMAVRDVAPGFHVLELDGNEWNYSPRFEGDYPPAKVLHFKGKRKDWMRRLWQSATTPN